jgi:hypothetical protein
MPGTCGRLTCLLRQLSPLMQRWNKPLQRQVLRRTSAQRKALSGADVFTSRSLFAPLAWRERSCSAHIPPASRQPNLVIGGRLPRSTGGQLPPHVPVQIEAALTDRVTAGSAESLASLAACMKVSGSAMTLWRNPTCDRASLMALALCAHPASAPRPPDRRTAITALHHDALTLEIPWNCSPCVGWQLGWPVSDTPPSTPRRRSSCWRSCALWRLSYPFATDRPPGAKSVRRIRCAPRKTWRRGCGAAGACGAPRLDTGGRCSWTQVHSASGSPPGCGVLIPSSVRRNVTAGH